MKPEWRTYSRLRYVVSRSKHGLKQELIVAAFGYDHTIDFGCDRSRRWNDVDSFVWILRMSVNGDLLFEPLI